MSVDVARESDAPTLSGISAAEKDFARQGVIEDCRIDGRKRQEFRPLQLATGVSRSALGSARVRNTECDVTCAVTADVVAPSLDRPDDGTILVSVQFASPLAADSQLRAFSDDSTSLARRLGHAILSGPLNESFLPRSALVILKKRFVWRVCVDILVVNLGGGLTDVVSYAVVAALRNTKLPVIKIILEEGFEGGVGEGDDNDEAADGALDTSDLTMNDPNIKEEPDNGLFDFNLIRLTKLIDFQVANDREGIPFPQIDSIPIIISIGQIEGHHICDLNFEERVSADSIVTGLVGRDGQVQGLKKVGGSAMSLSFIASIIPLLRSMGREVYDAIGDAVRRATVESDKKSGTYSWTQDLLPL